MGVKFKIDGKQYLKVEPDTQNQEKQSSNAPISFNTDNGIQDIKQPTELGESLRELNKDDIEDDRASGIDLRANLHQMEVPFILGLDALVRLGVLPVDCLSFTRQKKRLSVSINALGRENIVNIVGGQRDHKENTANGGFFKNFLGLGGEKKQ